MPKRRARPTALTERERRFVEAYMGAAAGNATEACRRAGYRGSDNALGVQGRRLLRKAKVREAIESRVQGDPAIATRRERQQFWTAVMLGTGAYRRAKLGSRLKASELLGKSQADFIERHRIEDPRRLLADLLGVTAEELPE